MPAYREKLTKQIDAEKERKHSLQTQVEAMERSIISLQERGKVTLKSKLQELGITGKSCRRISASTSSYDVTFFPHLQQRQRTASSPSARV